MMKWQLIRALEEHGVRTHIDADEFERVIAETECVFACGRMVIEYTEFRPVAEGVYSRKAARAFLGY